MKKSAIRQRITQYLDYKGISEYSSERAIGKSKGFWNKSMNPSSDVLEKICGVYSDISTEWLLTGNGDMIKTDKETMKGKQVLIVPISAQGGSLTDFEASVSEYECEKIISPIKDAELAITVKGHSMEPEYPEKSLVFVKKINEKAFLEWGEVYVLSTVNGTVIKQIEKSEKDEYITCVPLNKDKQYSPYEILKSDIYGYYKVLMSMNLK